MIVMIRVQLRVSDHFMQYVRDLRKREETAGQEAAGSGEESRSRSYAIVPATTVS